VEEVERDLSNGAICNDFRWSWKVILATGHLSRASVSKNTAYVAYELITTTAYNYCHVRTEVPYSHYILRLCMCSQSGEKLKVKFIKVDVFLCIYLARAVQRY